jgi:hypothetical protein
MPAHRRRSLKVVSARRAARSLPLRPVSCDPTIARSITSVEIVGPYCFMPTKDGCTIWCFAVQSAAAITQPIPESTRRCPQIERVPGHPERASGLWAQPKCRHCGALITRGLPDGDVAQPLPNLRTCKHRAPQPQTCARDRSRRLSSHRCSVQPACGSRCRSRINRASD